MRVQLLRYDGMDGWRISLWVLWIWCWYIGRCFCLSWSEGRGEGLVISNLKGMDWSKGRLMLILSLTVVAEVV